MNEVDGGIRVLISMELFHLGSTLMACSWPARRKLTRRALRVSRVSQRTVLPFHCLSLRFAAFPCGLITLA